MISFFANAFRLFRILIIFIASGCLQSLLELFIFTTSSRDEALQRLGIRINRFLLSAGPSFVKLGQMLSTRPDIVGEILSLSLSQLQDKVPPFAFIKVKRTLEKELKAPLHSLFLDFEHMPVAAASIAQVHRAITMDGRKVAVKILRPRIEKKFVRDLKLFYFLANLVLYFFSQTRVMKLNKIVEALEQSINIETDLRIEAASADQLRENFSGDPTIYIPSIIWQHTSRRVMTQEWVEGIPINDHKRLNEAGYDLHQIAKNLAVTFFNQAYRDGFFHADIHPGNIMICEAGRIALVDFGIMGSLEKEDRIFVAKTLHGFITRDYKSISDIHFEMGYVPKTQSREAFSLACRSIGEPIVGMPVNKISIGTLLKQLFEISRKFDMNIQAKFLLLQKTLVTVEGTGYSLFPEVNMWQLAEPWIKDWARENFGPKAKLLSAKENLVELSHSFPNVVNKMSKFLDKMENHVTDSGLRILHRNEEKREKRSRMFVVFTAAFLLGMMFGIMAAGH